MDVSKLDIFIPTVKQSILHKTYIYKINVVYGTKQWSIEHRFSEFMKLCTDLISNDYEGLPVPPSRTIIRPQDAASIERRRLHLQSWLKCLCIRPDIRASPIFLNFIEFEKNTNIQMPFTSLKLKQSTRTVKPQVSDIVFIPEKPMFLSSSKESSNTTRIGKFWSLLDKTSNSCLQLWYFNAFTMENSVENFEEYGREFYIENINCIFYHPETNRIFCGLENGVIRVLNVQKKPEPYSFHFVVENELQTHSESIICFKGFIEPVIGRLLSISIDNTVRVISCETLNIICSGKIQKRLYSAEKLTAGTLEPLLDNNNILSSRLFIGTDNGRVFIFSCEQNPPLYVETLQLAAPISCIEIVGSNLIIAYSYLISFYKLPAALNDSNITLVRTYEIDANFKGKTIRCLAVAKSEPLLFVGHRRAVSIWNCITHTCVSIKVVHKDDIVKMQVYETIDKNTQEPIIHLITASKDGCIHRWLVPKTVDLVLWESEELKLAKSTYNNNNNNNIKPELNSSPDLMNKFASGLSTGFIYNEDEEEDENTYIISNVTAVPHRH